MPSEFSDLRVNKDERTMLEFWDQNKELIEDHLKNINNDVFDGNGYFTRPHYKGGFFSLRSYGQKPPLTKPNLFLRTPNGSSIAICPATNTTFRIVVEDRSGNPYWRAWETPLAYLVRDLREAVSLLTCTTNLLS